MTSFISLVDIEQLAFPSLIRLRVTLELEMGVGLGWDG